MEKVPTKGRERELTGGPETVLTIAMEEVLTLPMENLLDIHTSDPSIAVHAATCPGVAEARKASIVSPDMKSALAAPIALKLQ